MRRGFQCVWQAWAERPRCFPPAPAQSLRHRFLVRIGRPDGKQLAAGRFRDHVSNQPRVPGNSIVLVLDAGGRIGIYTCRQIGIFAVGKVGNQDTAVRTACIRRGLCRRIYGSGLRWIGRRFLRHLYLFHRIAAAGRHAEYTGCCKA